MNLTGYIRAIYPVITLGKLNQQIFLCASFCFPNPSALKHDWPSPQQTFLECQVRQQRLNECLQTGTGKGISTQLSSDHEGSGIGWTIGERCAGMQ